MSVFCEFTAIDDFGRLVDASDWSTQQNEEPEDCVKDG